MNTLQYRVRLSNLKMHLSIANNYFFLLSITKEYEELIEELLSILENNE